MEQDEYEVMYSVEDRHWWYRGMVAITRSILDRFVGRGGERRILDAGCGTGGTSENLADYGVVTGIDLSTEALRFCRRRQLARLTQASVLLLPFPDASFDLVTSFDVLCNVEVGANGEALREFWRVLEPGGYVFLRLPAYNWLRGRHDRAVHIRHRYTRSELERLLRGAGYHIICSSYANSVLFPIAAMKRLGERLLPRREGSDMTLGVGPLNGVLTAVLAAEAPFISSGVVPFGLTVLALARRPWDRSEGDSGGGGRSGPRLRGAR